MAKYFSRLLTAAFYVCIVLSTFDSKIWQFLLLSTAIIFGTMIYTRIRFTREALCCPKPATHHLGAGMLAYSFCRIAFANNNPLGGPMMSIRDQAIPLPVFIAAGLITLIASRMSCKKLV